MNSFLLHAPRAHRPLLALLALLLSTAAFAAPRPDAADPKVRYQRESAACAAVRVADDRANCLSEASTRFAGTQPPVPEESADILQRNALKRCESLRGDDRQDCVARIQGQGSTSGSVASGGIYRELVTVVVGTPEATAPVDATADAAVPPTK